MSLETTSAPPGASFLWQPPSRVFTPEDFSADERLMIETAEQFSRKEVLPVVERLEKQEEGLMPALIRKAGELGFLGMDAPERFGGLGLGKNLAARVLEFISLDGSFSVTAGVTSGIGQSGLVMFGTEEQKARYLPKVVSGEWIAAYCLSEPDSGSDALSGRARARLVGDDWVLDGTKMWVSNAKWAQLFLVMAKTDGDMLSAFLVERGYPGVTVAREEHKMGLKGSSTARVILEEARVPKQNLLFEPGQGHRVALNSLNLGRFKLASMSLGPARQALAEAASYVQERRQFGRRICEFGLIQKKLAEMAARFFVAESAVYRTGAMIDDAFQRNGGTPEGNRKAAEEYALECSICKVVASEAQAFIVDEALQCFGGYGFTEEFPAARHYRDARVSRIYEGTNEINRLLIGTRLLRKMMENSFALPTDAGPFVSALACRALRSLLASSEAESLASAVVGGSEQVKVAAIADLAILAYAEQSALLRASQVGGTAPGIAALGLREIHRAALGAMQQIEPSYTPALPALHAPDVGDVARRVLDAGGPLRQ